MSRPARRLLGIAFACCALCAAGCGSTPHATLSVTPRDGAADAPLRISVGGAPPRAVIRARVIDAHGLPWTSETSVADVRRDPAKPLWNLRHGDDSWAEPLPGFDVRLDLVDGGKSLASTTVKRRVAAPGVRGHDAAGRGLVGRVYEGAGGARGAAVLILGGSEGGLGGVPIAATLASHGHPAMALAYFGEPGLPDTLRDIPLEYFARAIKELGADGRPVVVLGVSRGGEAALLLGATYPGLVGGVVAVVPSNVVNGALQGGAAWTLHGRRVPYAEIVGDPASSEAPDALIRAERTRGPILTVSAGHDTVWPSGPYTEALHARLDRRHFRYAHRDIRIPDAGHLVGAALPYRPTPAIPEAGGSPTADAAGKATAWPQILKFIDGR